MAETWSPSIPESPAPLYERLLDVMTKDMAGGRLAAGTRLPPQRELAIKLGISLGTVTRAYAEAERRGLVTAHVGRGSFVAARADSVGRRDTTAGTIDLCRNIPPAGPARAHKDRLFQSLRGPMPDDLLDYAPIFGAPDHRDAVALWLARHLKIPRAQATEVILSVGAQQAMALAFAAVCAPGDIVLCEALTFFGARALADHGGYRLQPVAMDEQGMCPDDLDAAVMRTGARVIYTLPTLQNPTARMMGTDRRAAIIEVARRRDLWIIEDDAYGYLARLHPGYVPLATLAPDRCFYLGSMSKILAPGLRLGYLVPPSGGRHNDAIARQLRATTYTANGFGSHIAAHAIRSGLADRIAAEVEEESRARLLIARESLGDLMDMPPVDTCLHIWLPMSELTAERAAGRAMRRGVEVTPPTAAVVGAGQSGLRLCLGGAATRDDLKAALAVVRDAILHAEDGAASSVV